MSETYQTRIVKATWEFEVDGSWNETDDECIEIAKEEFKSEFGKYMVDEFNFSLLKRIA